MPKVLVHAGFHKTGTKSVQVALDENRDLLAPHLRVFTRDDVVPMVEAARRYSDSRDDIHLAEFDATCEDFFTRLAREDSRDVLISTEDLSGLLPGRRNVTRYDAAPRLMAVMERAITAHAQAEALFFFSTRAPKGWLNSVWWQHLRITRLTEDFQTYAARAEEAADLDAIIAEIREGLHSAKVTWAALDDTKSHPLGPLSPILALLNLPEHVADSLVIGRPQNARPNAGLEEIYLALNRSSLPDRTISEVKKQVLRVARRQAEKKDHDT